MRALALGLLLASCAASPRAARPVAPAPPRPAPAHAPASREALTVLPAWSARPLVVALDDGATGWVFGGVRAVRAREGEVTVADTTSREALVEAWPLARGVVFRDASQRLWRASSFLAPLEALDADAARVLSPPSSRGALAWTSRGRAWVSDGGPRVESPALAALSPREVTFCDARRARARADDGLLDLSDDGGLTWRLVDAPAQLAPCDAPAPAPSPAPDEALTRRVRNVALGRAPGALEAAGAVSVADRARLLADDEGVTARVDDGPPARIVTGARCEVHPWGACAAVLCESERAPTLRRVCARDAVDVVEHPCRGAFVLSDDGRHAACADASLAVWRLDVEGPAPARAELPFAALVRATMHGDALWYARERELVDGPRATPLPEAFDAVAALDDARRVAHAGGALWAIRDGGAWRRLEAPWQPSGGDGSRYLARGDVSPALPAFACRAGECRLGALVVRDPDALADAAPRESSRDEARADWEGPSLFEEPWLAGCVFAGPLTRRRPLAGVTLQTPVYAAVREREGAATVQWIGGAAVREATLPPLPPVLSAGDDPDEVYPQGTPGAVEATGARLHLATWDRREEAALWTLTPGAGEPRTQRLPGAVSARPDDVRWDGLTLPDGGAAVAQVVAGDGESTARLWTFDPRDVAVSTAALRTRRDPVVAVVDGDAGLATLTPRDDRTVAVAFQGTRLARRWTLRAGDALPPCGPPRAPRGLAEVNVDARVETPGEGAGRRRVIRVTRVRLRFEGDRACVDRASGVTAHPAPNGDGMRSATVFFEVRAAGIAGVELGGDRPVPVRCPRPDVGAARAR